MSKHLYKWLACLILVLTLPVAAAGEKIRAFGPESFEKILANHAGKPFVVVVWGLDCAYCGSSFAALAQAQRKQELRVVTIAVDPADDPQARKLVLKKLHSSGLVSEPWAFGAAPAEQLRYAIDPKWYGEMPRTYWFNSKGEKRAYSGALSTSLIDKLSSH
jgi:hypothetical protein